MPPTLIESFEHHMPVNNKWAPRFRIYDRNTINDPEYLSDINIDVYFSHDATSRQVKP
jgi:hypothetical protein